MTKNQKVILRFLDGSLAKGYIKNFTVADDFIFIEDESSNSQKIKIDTLKAIFFVKKFEGNKEHRERKAFSGRKARSRRVFLRFKDGESLTGYLEGEASWKKGFFLEHKKGKGFFLKPSDEESNNLRVFVVTSSLRDVAEIG